MRTRRCRRRSARRFWRRQGAGCTSSERRGPRPHPYGLRAPAGSNIPSGW